jgi:hypothetical protein
MPEPIPTNRSVSRSRTRGPGSASTPYLGPTPQPYRDHAHRPEPPPPNREARSFRIHSAAALAAVGASVIMWIYGASAYSGGRDVTGDGVRALVGLVVFVVAAIVVISWFRSLRDGLSALRRERADRLAYDPPLERHRD